MKCQMKKPESEPEDEHFEPVFSFTVEFDLFPAIMFVVLLGAVACMFYLVFAG